MTRERIELYDYLTIVTEARRWLRLTASLLKPSVVSPVLTIVTRMGNGWTHRQMMMRPSQKGNAHHTEN